jgi:hypothetical protein
LLAHSDYVVIAQVKIAGALLNFKELLVPAEHLISKLLIVRSCFLVIPAIVSAARNQCSACFRAQGAIAGEAVSLKKSFELWDELPWTSSAPALRVVKEV